MSLVSAELVDSYDHLDQRVRAALEELQNTISHAFPGTTFIVARGHDEPNNVHLKAVVDLDDADEVLDLVGDRVDELQIEEGIPIHVISIRRPERVLATLERR
jgi:hypothetical protein